MKIGIVTHPLFYNYGGILQNYALQTVLKRQGHTPVTLDYLPVNSRLRWFFSTIKSIILLPLKNKRRHFMPFPVPCKRIGGFASFVNRYIQTTDPVRYYSRRTVLDNKCDAIIVGSDQVWRPIYSKCIEDYFLHFLQDVRIKKLSYAASFGVDNWEFSQKQTKVCRKLAHQFNAISVREESGINLCQQYLGVDAINVLDPSLLLTKYDYETLLDPHRPQIGDYLAAYILDDSKEKRIEIEKISQEKKLPIKFFTAGIDATLSVEEWLAIFHDASYIVTDSFHGTVFSIIFEKDFKCMINKKRGGSRFDTILKIYQEGTLDEMRKKSIQFLLRNLTQ